jgi:Ni,Fe-hydrogenase I large subunit
MTVKNAQNQINEAVASWDGVTAHPHRFGGTEYRLGRREIGHIHGDYLVDIPFPTKIREEVVAAGRAEPHHVLPDSGWVSFYIREPADVERAIELLQQSYEIAINQRKRRKKMEEAPT